MITLGDVHKSVPQPFSAARRTWDKAYQKMTMYLAEEAIFAPDQSDQE
tara:strand:+ start:7320 stop:7463 length:144 start_codon:yes stop_codon:yes gene_type:complete